MPTVFKCLTAYCKRHQKEPLSRLQKRELGQKVINIWFAQGILCTLHRVTIIEPEGPVTVLSYPKFFLPTIYQLISAYYKRHTLPIAYRYPTSRHGIPNKYPSDTQQIPYRYRIDTLPLGYQKPIDPLRIPNNKGTGKVAEGVCPGSGKRKRKRIPLGKKPAFTDNLLKNC